MIRGSVTRWFLTSVVVVGASTVLVAYEQQIRELAGEMAASLLASGKKNVAVVDFTDLQGNAAELGRFLAEELSVALTRGAKGFKVVDRTHPRRSCRNTS